MHRLAPAYALLSILAAEQATLADAPETTDTLDMEAAITRGEIRLGLRHAVALAMQRGSLQAARARVEAAKAQRDGLQVGLWPRLELGASYTRLSRVRNDGLLNLDANATDSSERIASLADPAARELWESQFGLLNDLASQGAIAVPQNRYGSFAQLSYPISQVALELAPQLRAAGFAQQAQAFTAAAAEADVAYGTSLAYLQLAEAKATHAVEGSALRLAERQLADAQAQLRQGLGDRADVARFAARVGELERTVAETQRHVIESRARLCIPIDFEHAESTLALDGRETRQGTLRPTTTSQRHEPQALKRQMKAARDRERAAARAALPSLNASARIDYAQPAPYFVPPNSSFESVWTLSVGLSWSPNDLLRARAGANAEAAQRKALAGELRELKHTIQIERKVAVAAAKAARAQLQSATEELAAAQVALQKAQRSYATGLSDATDLLDAAVAVDRAALGRVRAGIATERARFAEAHAAGTRWWRLETH